MHNSIKLSELFVTGGSILAADELQRWNEFDLKVKKAACRASRAYTGIFSGGGRIPQLHSCGEAVPGYGAEPQMIQSSQPVWSRREEPNLSESSLAGGL